MEAGARLRTDSSHRLSGGQEHRSWENGSVDCSSKQLTVTQSHRHTHLRCFHQPERAVMHAITTVWAIYSYPVLFCSNSGADETPAIFYFYLFLFCWKNVELIFGSAIKSGAFGVEYNNNLTLHLSSAESHSSQYSDSQSK